MGEGLLRAVAERLALLRGVDARDADLVLQVVGVEDGERVAVGDCDYAAFEALGCRGGVKEGREKAQQEEQGARHRERIPTRVHGWM
jgi:hypothetical protein